MAVTVAIVIGRQALSASAWLRIARRAVVVMSPRPCYCCVRFYCCTTEWVELLQLQTCLAKWVLPWPWHVVCFVVCLLLFVCCCYWFVVVIDLLLLLSSSSSSTWLLLLSVRATRCLTLKTVTKLCQICVKFVSNLCWKFNTEYCVEIVLKLCWNCVKIVSKLCQNCVEPYELKNCKIF